MKAELVRLLGAPERAAYWEWEYRLNGTSTSHPLVLQDEGGQIIGFNGLIPIRLKLENEELDGVWSCDFFVDERLRGQGLGRSIKQVLRQEFPCVLVFGMNSKAESVLRATGWKPASTVFTYRRFNRGLKPSRLLRRLLQLAMIPKRLGRPRLPAFRAEFIDRLPGASEVDELWKSVACRYGKAVVRDHAYLSWRYGTDAPPGYRFIVLRDRNLDLKAILVCREAADRAYIVDFLGDPTDSALLDSAIGRFIRRFRHQQLLLTSTSSESIAGSLERNGFYRGRDHSRFMVSVPEHVADPQGNWFVLPGDSDGELLNAMNSREHLLIERKSEDDFARLREEWTDLWERSAHPNLFLHWDWMWCWWQQWGCSLGAELILLTARDAAGQLTGIAPLYRHRTGMGNRRIQLVGSAWKDQHAIRSEYLDFLCDRRMAQAAGRALFQELMAHDWDELVLCDVLPESEVMNQLAGSKGGYSRIVASDRSVRVQLRQPLADYKAGLTQNARRAIFNKRRLLEGVGCSFERISAERFDQFVEAANQLHHIRWRTPCFTTDVVEFYRSLMSLGTVDPGLSFILCEREPVSALFDLRLGREIYNLQSSFDDRFSSRLSLGLMHLGYAIEEAMTTGDEFGYDLLAGRGKNTYYKLQFGGDVRTLTTVHLTRGSMRLVYRGYDGLPEGMKATLRRLRGSTAAGNAS